MPQTKEIQEQIWINPIEIYLQYSGKVSEPLLRFLDSNHGENRYLQIKTTWDSGELSQEWPPYQSSSQSASTTPLGGQTQWDYAAGQRSTGHKQVDLRMAQGIK